MTRCPECGRDMPAHMKHVPSRETDGSRYAGNHPCRWVAVDKDGRSWREQVEWQRLKRVAKKAAAGVRARRSEGVSEPREVGTHV